MTYELVELNNIMIFQIINSVLILIVFIGIPVMIIRYLRRIDRRLKSIEAMLEKHERPAIKVD